MSCITRPSRWEGTSEHQVAEQPLMCPQVGHGWSHALLFRHFMSVCLDEIWAYAINFFRYVQAYTMRPSP